MVSIALEGVFLQGRVLRVAAVFVSPAAIRVGGKHPNLGRLERALPHMRAARASVSRARTDNMRHPQTTSTLMRAFEIARSGEARDVERIRTALSREGYDQHQIFGRTLCKQLSDIIRHARVPQGQREAQSYGTESSNPD
jgi:hypothetical protein